MQTGLNHHRGYAATGRLCMLAGLTGMFGASAAIAMQPPAAPVPAIVAPATDPDLQQAYGLSRAYQKIAREVTPSVVNITAKKGGDIVQPRQPQAQPRRRGGGQSPQSPMDDPFFEQFMRQFGGGGQFGPQGPYKTPEQVGTGSGIVVTRDGYILTNNHVVEDAKELIVQFKDNGTRYNAKLVGRDPGTDVAVIKIDGDSFPAVHMGDSDEVQVGEIVVAIGNPFGLNYSVTSGIVSAKGREVADLAQQRGAVFQDFIQTDAAINPGNSGGPLVNLKGEVVGMNTAIFSRSGGYMGIGFSIPSNMAKLVMDSLISGGTVQRGWLGVNMQPLTEDLAKSLNYKGTDGVLVADAVPDSPAAAAGLKSEDIITSIDGKPARSLTALRNTIATMAPGKQVDVTYIRNGETKTAKVTLAKRPAEVAAGDDEATPGGASENESRLGVAVQDLTPDWLEKLKDKNAKGVVVTDVTAGSPAASLGFEPGVVIAAINGSPITNVAEFKAAMAKADLSRGVRMAVRLNGQTRLVSFQIAK